MAVIEGLARATWRILVPSLYQAGYSFRGAISIMRSVYGPLRTQTALVDWRSLNQLIKGEYAARNVDPVKRFPQNKMVETDLGRAYKYRVYGTATYTDKLTGETSTKNISMYTNSWLSKNGWADQFEGWKEKTDYETGWSLTGVDMKVTEHNAGFSY